MSDASEPAVNLVRGDFVDCRGDAAAAPHAPQRFALPPGRSIPCPICGARYQRAPDWEALSGAVWPDAR